MTNLFRKFFVEKQAEILDFIRELCEIESPSHHVAGSKRIVDFIETKAQKLKCVDSIERVFSENYGDHIVIRAFQNSNPTEKQILMLGHTDTVHPVGSLAERPFRIDGDKVFAPGIFDMKAGIALIIFSLQALETLNIKPQSPITILLDCDEEIGSPSGREVVECEAKNAKACFVFEPSAPSGMVKTGRKGTANYTLKAHGIPAHAGLEPQRGASAILELAHQIPKIQALNDYENGTTANVCLIRGGTATNVIPAEAEVEIDVRFTKMSEAEKVERSIFGLQNCDERVSLEIVGEINRPPMERTEKVIELYEKARTIAESISYEIGETQVGGASDGNFVGALGVPVLDGLGVQGDGAHTFHEYILASDIPNRGALIASLIQST